MYLDTFLGSVGVDQAVVQKIRSVLDDYAEAIGSVKLSEASRFGGSSAGARMVTETNRAQDHIVAAMQELAGGLREFGVNLELWQDDMTFTDEDAGARIQAIRSVQDTVAATDFRNAPDPAAATGGA